MDAYGSREDNDPEPEEHGRSLEPSDARLGDLPLGKRTMVRSCE